MSIFDGIYTEKMVEEIKKIIKEKSNSIFDDMFQSGGFSAPPEPAIHFNCRHEPVYHSDNQFKSGRTYHRDGTTIEWRNYAIIKTDGREFKAPIIKEG